MVMPYSHYQKALFKYNIGTMNLLKKPKEDSALKLPWHLRDWCNNMLSLNIPLQAQNSHNLTKGAQKQAILECHPNYKQNL